MTQREEQTMMEREDVDAFVPTISVIVPVYNVE